jgi:hypothetical protein
VINADGTANVTIPNNEKDGGYAIWGPKAPRGSIAATSLVLTTVASTQSPDSSTVPNGVRLLTPIDRVVANSATLVLTLQDEGLDDNALLRIDDGSINAVGTPILGGGEFKGFQRFTSADPGVTGSGVYSAMIDATKLTKGFHYIEVVAFLKRDPGEPPVFETFCKVIEVDH